MCQLLDPVEVSNQGNSNPTMIIHILFEITVLAKILRTEIVLYLLHQHKALIICWRWKPGRGNYRRYLMCDYRHASDSLKWRRQRRQWRQEIIKRRKFIAHGRHNMTEMRWHAKERHHSR